METYFIRHPLNKISVDDKTRKRMWNERRIFIHFEWDKSGNKKFDSKSINPEDYLGADKRAVGALVRLARDGGYVCAQYSDHEEWLVGFVPKGSNIRLVKGKWRPENPPPKGHDGISIIKTVQVHKSRLVNAYDYAALQSAQPRQGTIMRWPSVQESIQRIVLGQKRLVIFDNLGASEQEIMCAEFLRLRGANTFRLPRLICLLRDVGRTMKDLDILGIASDGKRIFAQITHYDWNSCEAKEKLNSLVKYQNRKNIHLLFFCDCEKQLKVDGIFIVPIRDVFGIFVKTPTGRIWKRHL